MKDDRECLKIMLEAIERIEKYSVYGRIIFEDNELIQNWTLYHLLILEEAIRSISDDFQKEHDDIPWVKFIGVKGMMVRRYFKLDTDLIWRVVVRDLPYLKQKVKSSLDGKR